MLRSNNNKCSSGFPHSEIHGSKLILSSPWLIAEYHVLHRLLLPRHPPNALLALDLIQRKTGFLRSEVVHNVRTLVRGPDTVSVLDLDNVAVRACPPKTPHAGSGNADFLMSSRCQSSSVLPPCGCLRTFRVRLDGGTRQKPCSTVKSEIAERQWWSVSGSNRRPPACKAGALPAELTPRIVCCPPAADVRSSPALGRLGAPLGAGYPTAQRAARSVRPPEADNPGELGGSRWTRTIDLTLIRRVL